MDPHAYLGAPNLEDSINAPLRFANPHQVGTVMANFARHQMCLKNGGGELCSAIAVKCDYVNHLVASFVLLNKLSAGNNEVVGVFILVALKVK